MNRSSEPVSSELAGRIEAARAVPEVAAEAAQARLLARLAAHSPRRAARAPRWLGLAAAAALAAVALFALPLLRDGGQAFAAVRAHFSAFRSLSMSTEQRLRGALLQRSQVQVDAVGRVRTDVGDQLSVIVDPVAGHVLTLLHGPRAATRVPLTVSPAAPAEGLEWLDELRRFQGEAHRLPGTKRLDGREVHGWELELGGVATVLWAAPDGLPVAMEQRLPGGMELQHRFRFDEPLLADGVDSRVPLGYREAAPDAD